MEFIIVTGMAGSGKTLALNALEDIGYYCVENLPLSFLPQFVDLCRERGGRLSRVAAVIDIRSCDSFSELVSAYLTIRQTEPIGAAEPFHCRMLYLEASEATLQNRFRTSRRSHPLAERFEGNLPAAFAFEREMLQPVRVHADYLIDSSLLSASQLKEQVKTLFMAHISDAMLIQVMSFGFQYGAPMEVDLMYDMRCLPNPYYVAELRDHTGCEESVREYVMNAPESREYYHKVQDMLDFVIPLYVKEGRPQLVIGFGCTGGRHRSVTFAELIFQHLREHGYHVIKQHRDFKK